MPRNIEDPEPWMIEGSDQEPPLFWKVLFEFAQEFDKALERELKEMGARWGDVPDLLADGSGEAEP